MVKPKKRPKQRNKHLRAGENALDHSFVAGLATPVIFSSDDQHRECRRLASRVDGTLSSHVTTRIPHEAMLVPSWPHIQLGQATISGRTCSDDRSAEVLRSA